MDLSKLTPDEILDGHLLSAIKGDIYPLIYSKKVKKNAGFFASMQLILTLTDFLGTLYSGSDQHNAFYAVKYIRTYMGQVNKVYKNVGGIIYYIWRHGTVHQRLPNKLKMNRKITTTFSVDNETSCVESVFAAKGQIHICLPKFYEDFVQSIKLFLNDVKTSRYRNAKFKEGWRKILSIEDWSTARNMPNRRWRYLTNKDYRFVCKRRP